MKTGGSTKSKLCILGVGPLSPSARAEGRPFGGYDWHLLSSTLKACGVHPDDAYYINTPDIYTNGYGDKTIAELNRHDFNMIVTLGDQALQLITDKRSVDKWQLSPLETLPRVECRRCVPTFDFKRLRIQYDHRFYFQKALHRAVEHCAPGPWGRKATEFYTRLNVNEFTEMVAEEVANDRRVWAVDIETSQGIINTMGLAPAADRAYAIKCRPEDLDPTDFHALWSYLRVFLETPEIKKIYQNNIFEAAYFNLYGIRVRGTWHDTMFAQKVLYPEFKSGLANVGRLFTMEPYWKDDGTLDADGGKRDWNKIEDWNAHLLYNCKDTSGTFEAAFNQREELKERGLLTWFDEYVMALAEPVQEMCLNGLPVDVAKVEQTGRDVQDKIHELVSGLSKPFNHRSPKQKIEHFKAKGYKIPSKRTQAGITRESLDELSLKKLRLKYPEDKDLSLLLKISKLEKFHSSYIDFAYDRDTGRVNYSMKAVGTETLRMSSGLDPWNRGFNAQTIPKKAKGFFPPPPGHVWVNVDLEKAESFFVAYRSCDAQLMKMLKGGEDIHSYVAANIFNVPVEQVIEEKNSGNPSKRQLGKKSGHGANYSMAANTFMESCLKEMDVVLTKKEATHILETYHSLFPGIRQWHAWVRSEIDTRARLTNPLGYTRYFYGRRDDNTYREAYAWEPQSTIPMVLNHMLLGLCRQRDKGLLEFNLHIQCHDSLLMSVRPERAAAVMAYCKDVSQWHPRLELPGGDLQIPTSCEYGEDLSKLKEWSGECLEV